MSVSGAYDDGFSTSKVPDRPGWHPYFMGIAERVADRADCTRRRASAVIVKDNRIVSTGYNGAPATQPGCLAGSCPRGRLSTDEVAAYSSYDSGPGMCIAVHAEANALLYADRAGTEGSVVYTWSSVGRGEPCMGCWRLIMGAGVARVIWQDHGVLKGIYESEFATVLANGGATDDIWWEVQ